MPVLRNVENMNYADIERGLNALGEKVNKDKFDILILCDFRFAQECLRAQRLQNFISVLQARTGELAIEDMDGGTFTISNGGVFGSLMGTPIINPPQSAILGMHGIFDRPVAVSGKVPFSSHL